MKDKKKKGKKLKKIVKLFLFIVVLGLILYLLYNVCDTRIKNIYISGNKNISDQDIIELAKLENYPDFFRTTNSTIKKRILKDERIKSVKIKRGFFEKIYIEVEEYKMLFIYDGKIVLENGNAIINKYDAKLPILINYTIDVKYEQLIKKMNKIDQEVLEKISEIKYDPNDYDEDRFLLFMNDSNLVYVTLTRFDYLNKYNETVTKLEGKKGTLYLDSGNYFEIR